MKLIDDDEAFRVLSDYYHHRTETQADALREALERVPEAVVRCKGCEYYMRDTIFGRGICGCDGSVRKPDAFCSDAERKEEQSDQESDTEAVK